MAPSRPDARRWQVAWLLGLALFAAVFLWLSALVWHTGTAVDLDRTLLRFGGDGSMSGIPRAGAQLGARPDRAVRLGSLDVVVIVAGALAVAALAWADWVGAALALVGPGLTGALTEYVVKPFVTPPSLATGRAFPSGHAGGATAVALVAVVLVYRRWGRVPALVVAPLAAIPVMAVAHGLVRLEYHYPTDVVGGVLLAMVVVLGSAALLPGADGAETPEQPATGARRCRRPGGGGSLGCRWRGR